MYAYSGWNAATYIAGEIHDPQRSLPLAILAATLIVIALYVGLNAVFLYTTPDRPDGRPGRRRADRRQAHLRRRGRPPRRRADLPRPHLLDQRHDLDRAARHAGDGRGHSDDARVRATSKNGVPAIAIIFQLCVTTLLMADAQLRVRARLHPVQPDVLLVPRRARRDRAAHPRARPEAPVPHVGLSVHAGRLPRGDRVHDVLPASSSGRGSRSPASPQCWPDFSFMQSR